MFYNNLRISSDPKVIGVNNGVYQMELDSSCFASKRDYESFILHFPESSTAPIHHPRPLVYKVLRKAKLTDFMCYSQIMRGAPIVLSQRAAQVLQGFRLKEHSMLEITLKDSAVQGYCLLRYPFTEVEKINFGESVFFTQAVGKERVYHQVRSAEEFAAFRRKYPLWEAETFLVDQAEASFDCIRLRGGGIYISERLQKAIEAHALSGCNIGVPGWTRLAFHEKLT